MSDLPDPRDELLRRFDVPVPRYTSYPTAPAWRASFGADDFARRLEAASRTDEPLALYVHIPFCREMCAYCGCNVVISKEPAKASAYLETLDRELALVRARLGARDRLSHLHWGGGSPNFLDEPRLRALHASIASRFRALDSAEVSVEVNPATTETRQLDVLRELGFNRLSMGVQDLDPDVQRAIGRVQTEERTRELLDRARALGFSGVNFDLIHGLPRQTVESFRRTIERVVAMRPDRVAVYSFAWVPEVRPHQRRLREDELPRGRAKLALLREAHRAFVEAGYVPIGIDHFALPGDDLARARDAGTLGRTFQGYMVRRARDSIGVGVTGISDLGGAFAQNQRPIGRWREAIEAGRFATEKGLARSEDDERRAALIESLLCLFRAEVDPELFARELDELRALERHGLVEVDGTVVRVTPLGRIFVRNVASVFDAYLARPASFSRSV